MPTPKSTPNATPSRQSSILSFFNKTPTSAAGTSSPKPTTSRAPPSEDTTPKKLSAVTLPRKNVEVSPNENEATSSRKRAPPDSDESPVVVERPPARRAATAAKKRRVILSDDDEDEDDVDFAMDVDASKANDESSEDSDSDASGGDESEAYTSEDEPVTPKKAAKKVATPPSTGRHRMVLIQSDDESDVDMEAPSTPKSSTKAKPPSTPKTPGGTVKTAYQSFANNDTPSKTPNKAPKTGDFVNPESFPHESFDFLKPEKIRDANKRRPDDPDYDPKTLYVPPDFLKQQTPGHQQFWQMKSKFFDTVIFFKVGKFYELYHMDAITGIECLDLTPMRGAYAHAGFPEIAYGKYSDMLISRGFKVARVEQTETPAMLAERNKTKGAKDKVVTREVCRVTTASTRTFGVLDGNDEKDFILSIEANANYLMAIAEQQVTDKESVYGVCFVDTSVGRFIMTQFTDDACRSTLRTLVAQFQPCHVIFPKGQITHGTQSVFNSALAAVQKEALFDTKEFYSVDKTVSKLLEDNYLGADVDSWPADLKKFLDTSLHIPKAEPDQELVIRALGGLMFYLERCLIDVDVFSLRDFVAYTPPDLNGDAKPVELTGRERWQNKNLILDGPTLLNLHLVPPFTGKKVADGLRDSTAIKFSLLRTIDYCKTPFGKRLLRQWVCAPSCDADVIQARQDAIEFLMKAETEGFLTKLSDALKKMPDLERLIQKVHTNGLKYRAEKHPDGRAQMFFATNYNKRKINDFIMTLIGFEKLAKLHKYFMNQFGDSETPALVNKCIGSGFPDVAADLKHFEQAFDRNAALETGSITPRRGIVADYDAALKAVDDAERAIQEYLSQERSRWKNSSIVLQGSGKMRYLLEFPDNVAPKLPTSEYDFKSQRKGFKRYGTVELAKLCNTLFAAENERDRVAEDVTRRVFEDFAERHFVKFSLFMGDNNQNYNQKAETNGPTSSPTSPSSTVSPPWRHMPRNAPISPFRCAAPSLISTPMSRFSRCVAVITHC
uniref:MUTSd domain-containing protein n=1 Tax=Panagrellus redivivus TaxID=6233 RepID=A0A7E4W282_PANRE